jgi:internalin A
MSLEEALRRIQEAYDTHATVLDLGGCDIDELPPEMQPLTWLEELRVDSDEEWQINGYSSKRGNLKQLPEWIDCFSSLITLKLRGQQLRLLISELFKLTELKELDLRSNELTALPPEIGHLTHLEELVLSNNYLQVLPLELFSLTKLRWLVLIDNQLTVLPAEIKNLTQLSYLLLYRNKLTILPSEIKQLLRLQWLDVRDNLLTMIPADIDYLNQLQHLLLSNNQLKTLPSGIFELVKLQYLLMDNNQLIAIPPEIMYLRQLEKLSINDNYLRRLPIELSYLTQVRQLSVQNNPLTIPTELISEDSSLFRPIFSYLHQLNEAGARPLMEAKLILLGEGTVGKTSLAKRLMHNAYNPTEGKTEGIAIERWPLLLEGGEVRLNVWDFAGQEITHATHQFFLTKRSLYLLALNCRASDHDNRLDYWLKLVQSFAPDSPVIVVGNKSDQHPLDLDQRGLMLKYPQIKAFVATSCANGAGIDELRAEIARQLSAMKHIRDVLPFSWWSVKHQLENLQRDYISHDRFKELCEQQDIDDEFVQKVLLGLLNDLGTVLSYHDDPRLAETNVLNPEWVTNGVYTLLNHAPLLDQRSGILTEAELTRILSRYGARYPATKCHFITEMMEKFELCFRIERGQWLIPDLLPREEPDSGTWDDALHFVYRYPVLLGSIISRFIVRFQHAIEGELRWRTGVVLKSGENRALVKADPEDARIDIRIGGDPANRRRFLSAIRHTFEQIHASLAGLRPEIKELVPLPGHPDHLVNYAELLGLEEMGARDYQAGILRRLFPLDQLLDGYESATQRQARQVNHYNDAPLDHLQALLETNQGLLRDYELQKAGFGNLYVPPYVTNQVEELGKEIERIREAMERRQLRGGR